MHKHILIALIITTMLVRAGQCTNDEIFCLVEKNADCPVESNHIPCPDNQCVLDYEETVYEYDDGPSNEPTGYHVVQHYKCDVQLGYYDIKSTYKTVEQKPLSQIPLDVDGFTNTVDKDFFCWKKAGCPVTACVETWDVSNPGNKVWYCGAPAQTPVNDPASKQQERRGDVLYPCP
jgi:hypothetical protein